MNVQNIAVSLIFNLLFSLEVRASMHWAVTENGRIEAQIDSVFHLRRPFDLIAFMEQEARLQSLDEIYNDLLERKSAIDRKWVGLDANGGDAGLGKGRGLRGVKAGDLEARLYAEDPDCVGAGGKPLSLSQLYPGSAGIASLMREEMRLENNLKSIKINEKGFNLLPDCERSYPLEISMQAFEHLLGWKERRNLSMEPEPTLESAFLFHLRSNPLYTDEWGKKSDYKVDDDDVESTASKEKERANRDIDLFGWKLGHALTVNGSSWPLHSLASLYWRIVGHAPHAMECARRAVHLAPREHRDLGLAQMGWILLSSGRPAEAAIVLHAALDHSSFNQPEPEDPSSQQTAPPATHLALANAYALLSDYNRSLACYENALKLQPGLRVAQLGRHSILCQQKLEKALLNMVDSLHDILTELQEYHKKQEEWLKLQEKLLWEQAPLEIRLLNYGHDKLLSTGTGQHKNCIHHQREGHMILSCDLEASHSLEIDITLSLQMLMKNVETQAKKISKAMSQRLDKGREMLSLHFSDDDEIEEEEIPMLSPPKPTPTPKSVPTPKPKVNEFIAPPPEEGVVYHGPKREHELDDHVMWEGQVEHIVTYETDRDGTRRTTSSQYCQTSKQKSAEYQQYVCRSSSTKSSSGGGPSSKWQEKANNKA